MEESRKKIVAALRKMGRGGERVGLVSLREGYGVSWLIG